MPFTFYPGYGENPAISPDGRLIAYVGQGIHGTNPLELYVQAIGSTDPLRVTHNRLGEENRRPAWDRTGGALAVLRTVGGTRLARILLMPARGGVGSDLGVDGVLASGRLAWSPDGKTLAFARLRGLNQSVIYECSVRGRTLRQVSFPRPGQSDCCPEFDPDGRRLAFKRNEVEIVVVDERTGAVRSLPARASWPGLTWSADGKSLVFSWSGGWEKWISEAPRCGSPLTSSDTTSWRLRSAATRWRASAGNLKRRGRERPGRDLFLRFRNRTDVANRASGPAGHGRPGYAGGIAE
jgi:Tol biopolymer transport system component